MARRSQARTGRCRRVTFSPRQRRRSTSRMPRQAAFRPGDICAATAGHARGHDSAAGSQDASERTGHHHLRRRKEKAMQSVKYERSGAVGHIVLCNPPHNLLNVAFYEQLREAVLSATSDDLRAVLVRAEGPNFCGGGDTAVLGSLTPAEFRLLTTEYNR